jgi:DNA-binding MarR family transcriptional regulator
MAEAHLRRRSSGNATTLQPSEQKTSSKAASYDLHAQVGYQLRVANQIALELFSEVIDPSFGAGKVTTVQFAVLSTAWEFPGIGQSELAAYVSMDMPTLNGVLKRLALRDLVRVEISQQDKRRRAIFLTASGEKLAAQLRETGAKVSRQILKPLSEQRRAVLMEALQDFIDAHRRR